MKTIILASHGHFAEGLLDTLQIIAGKQNHIETYCAYTKKGNIVNDISNLMKRHEGGELIVCTDLYGGSVNNCFMQYLQRPGFYLIAGINLPILLEIICREQQDTYSMLNDILKQNDQYIKFCNQISLQNVITEEF